MAAAVVFSMFVAVAGAAGLARQPTPGERQAIIQALPSYFQKYPIGCIWLGITLSDNGRYATVSPQDLNVGHSPCGLKYAGNGWFILRKLTRWKVIFVGSVNPPCSLGVPRDLSRCTKRK